uniref:Uncharacterized protein n=1 Tax=viral metagenome TaxID=1070528 RepID=A0A6C0JEJ3_9ZZZZ
MNDSIVKSFINYSTTEERAELKMTEIVCNICNDANKTNTTITEYINKKNILTKFLYYYLNNTSSEYIISDRLYSFIPIPSFVNFCIMFNVDKNKPYNKQIPKKILKQLMDDYEDTEKKYKKAYDEKYSEYATFKKLYCLF